MYGLAKTDTSARLKTCGKYLAIASGDVEVMVHLPSNDHGDELKEKIENWTLTNKLASYGDRTFVPACLDRFLLDEIANETVLVVHMTSVHDASTSAFSRRNADH